MKSIYIKFNATEDIVKFVNIVSKYNIDFDLVEGRILIDAKSYLGILSMELSDVVRLDIHSDDNEEVIQELSPFIVENR